MRADSLFVFAALALSACAEQDDAGQGGNSAQDIAAESIGPGGDTTAIDAATAADANMAADVEYNLVELNETNAVADEAKNAN